MILGIKRCKFLRDLVCHSTCSDPCRVRARSPFSRTFTTNIDSMLIPELFRNSSSPKCSVMASACSIIANSKSMTG
ncbi:MAG: hypothetical protein KME20_04785 [Kaiparowitsia implicata GSE-PSE-MK54-09C]|nr:hypothetical protein [Kaiparowitsia implicata GSE-PSE-MK54-09C]